MVTIQEADLYFSEVLHNAEWLESDDDTKNRAIKTAERQLARIVQLGFILPVEAVCEQAITLLRVDDGFFKAQLGNKQASVSGISVSYDLSDVTIVNGMPVSKVAIGYIRDMGGTVKGSVRLGRYQL
jgi:hypothetical protein